MAKRLVGECGDIGGQGAVAHEGIILRSDELLGEIAEARPLAPMGMQTAGLGPVSLRARLLLDSRRDRLKQAATMLTICDENKWVVAICNVLQSY